MSSLLDNLGQGHLVAGKITATSGTDAALTSNDGSATLTRDAAGDYTVTFGEAFLSAPTVTATIVDATFSTLAAVTVAMIAVATNSVQFNIVNNATNGTVTALADSGDIHFMAFGLRDN